MEVLHLNWVIELVAPEFTQTLQKIMDTTPADNFTVELQQLDTTPRAERAKWMLNSPEPPSLWHKLTTLLRDTVSPLGNKLSSSADRPAGSKGGTGTAVCFLQGLFPILKWGRDYKAAQFKNDFMAGLTLASLCIPQVCMNNYPESFFSLVFQDILSKML